MLKALTLIAFMAAPAAAMAQGAIQQSGPVSPGHLACWAYNGIEYDCGSIGSIQSGISAATPITANNITNPLGTWIGYLAGIPNPNPTVWTTAGRPVSPVVGMTGFNTTISQTETWNGSAWASGVASVNTRTGAVTLSLSDIPGAAPLASPSLTGTPLAPTATPGTNTTQISTTAFTNAAVAIETSRAETAEALLLPSLGVTNGSNAAAGNIGEYISSTVVFGSAVPLTTGTAQDITSISLTAGDWDVWGNVCYSVDPSTVVEGAFGWTSTTSATLPVPPNNGAETGWVGTVTGVVPYLAAGTQRISISAPTVVYLSTDSNFTTSTLSACGFIGARRVR